MIALDDLAVLNEAEFDAFWLQFGRATFAIAQRKRERTDWVILKELMFFGAKLVEIEVLGYSKRGTRPAVRIENQISDVGGAPNRLCHESRIHLRGMAVFVSVAGSIAVARNNIRARHLSRCCHPLLSGTIGEQAQ